MTLENEDVAEELETAETAEEEQDVETPEETGAGETEEQPGKEESPDDEAEEISASFGDAEQEQEQEPDDNSGSAPFRAMRKANREQAKQLKKLRAEMAERDKPAEPEVTEAPSLEECGFDEEIFALKMEKHLESKRVAAKKQAEADERVQAGQQAWQVQVERYEIQKAELAAPEYEESEAVVQELFTPQQQAMMVQGCDNTARLFYALGRNPTEAKKLAGESDPVKFSFAAAKLETKLKMKRSKKPTTVPESIPSGTGNSNTSDNALTKLRAKAATTGDYSQVVRYKAEQRRKAESRG